MTRQDKTAVAIAFPASTKAIMICIILNPPNKINIKLNTEAMILMTRRAIKLHFDGSFATNNPITPFVPKIRPVHIPVPIVK